MRLFHSFYQDNSSNGALYTWEAAKAGAESSNINPGGKLKEEGEDHWRSPDYGASDDSYRAVDKFAKLYQSRIQ